MPPTTATAPAQATERAPAQSTTSIVREERKSLSGTYHDAGALDGALHAAASRAHLISPAPAFGQLPAGFGVRLAAVRVDSRTETYPIPGGTKVGLSKVALDKIGHALGLSWDPVQSRRLDDGRDPRYCRYRAVGSYLGPDGIRHFVSAEKELDLRDGSPTVEGLNDQQRSKGKGDATRQIRELRMHILSHAETKARLRAIRSMGIRTSYDKDELERPFVAAQVMFTGQTDDPELRREFAKLQAQAALGGTSMLFGGPPAGTHLLPAEPPAPAPPVGEVVDDDDFDAAPASVADSTTVDDGEVY